MPKSPALPRHCESRGVVAAPIERVFAHVDDHARLSSHMRESSWMLAGGRMSVALGEGQGRQVGSRISLAGRVLGLELSVEEIVTAREPPWRKTWATVGRPRLLVIGPYRMGFELGSQGAGTMLRVVIDYALPERLPGRWLGRLLARRYAQWCTQRMVDDAIARFGRAG